MVWANITTRSVQHRLRRKSGLDDNPHLMIVDTLLSSLFCIALRQSTSFNVRLCESRPWCGDVDVSGQGRGRDDS